MASRALLLAVACFLLVNTEVSSQLDEELLVKNAALVAPVSPAYKSSPPPSPPPKSSPPPPPAVVKTPPSPPPVVKTPPPPPAAKPPRNKQECTPLCAVRCKFHSRQNICMRACLTCCDRCKCVPPGQYGNHDKCGQCYAGMTTRGGRRKCP
ncbi:Gibberellin-regulated protein 14 [Sesamum alatum]|uniref:Gibberellin-regulated protein 14 n=1 Tax=Sesamum alatum TaxID=300844 RepID=A0AAE1Y9Y7_9LAMI|nr:Gibberellin-regulated protein 14 [Sesamum alatum]